MNDFPLSASDCRDLLSGLPAGIVLCDARDQVIWANESFCELLETDPEAIVGADMSAVLGRDSDPVRTQVDRYVVTSDSGKSRWLECALSHIEAENGQVGSLRIFTDVSAFESRQKGRVATAAGRDPSRLDSKSGILNRQAIVQELSSQVSRSRRYGNDLTLVQVRFGPSAAARPQRGMAGHGAPAHRRGPQRRRCAGPTSSAPCLLWKYSSSCRSAASTRPTESSGRSRRPLPIIHLFKGTIR